MIGIFTTPFLENCAQFWQLTIFPRWRSENAFTTARFCYVRDWARGPLHFRQQCFARVVFRTPRALSRILNTKLWEFTFLCFLSSTKKDFFIFLVSEQFFISIQIVIIYKNKWNWNWIRTSALLLVFFSLPLPRA